MLWIWKRTLLHVKSLNVQFVQKILGFEWNWGVESLCQRNPGCFQLLIFALKIRTFKWSPIVKCLNPRSTLKYHLVIKTSSFFSQYLGRIEFSSRNIFLVLGVVLIALDREISAVVRQFSTFKDFLENSDILRISCCQLFKFKIFTKICFDDKNFRLLCSEYRAKNSWFLMKLRRWQHLIERYQRSWDSF